MNSSEENSTPPVAPENTAAPKAAAVMELETLHRMNHASLLEAAAARSLPIYRDASRHQLVLDLARDHLKMGGTLTVEGVLEFAPDAPMIRWPRFNFQPTPCDVTLPVPLLRQYELRPGIRISGTARMISERRMGLESVIAIEGIPAGEWKSPTEFDKLTAMFPNRRIYLE